MNQITTGDNEYALPRIHKVLDQLVDVKYFTKYVCNPLRPSTQNERQTSKFICPHKNVKQSK